MSDEHTFPPEPVARRRAPAGRAIASIVLALLVAALLNAERLEYTARNQPIGWQRTWAMRSAGPLADVSRLTRLNLPRKWLSEAADNVDPPPAIDTDDVLTAQERLAQGGTTTTTTTTIPTPTPADPLQILVAGDSLMGWVAPALEAQLAGEPVEVTLDYKVSTGLSRPDYFNWPARLEEDVASLDPDVVIVGFGGNDAQNIATDDGVLELGSPEWHEEYQRRVAQILDTLEAPGRTVYWIGLPLTLADNIERVAPKVTESIRAEIGIRPWAHYVDARPVLSPDGVYVDYLPGLDGEEVLVREADGVHPNRNGTELVVASMVDELKAERKLTP